MERAEAVKLGLKKYNTGRSCKHGHNVDRYTDSGACSACVKNLVTVSAGNSAAIRAKIEQATKKIYLFSQQSGFDAVKTVVDGLVAARCPDLPVDVVNPYPFVGKQVSRLTYQISVRVPLEDVDAAYSMGKAMLEPEPVTLPKIQEVQ